MNYYLHSYHTAMRYLIETRAATLPGRTLVARALRDLRRTKGRAAAQHERRHMYYVNSGGILTDERLQALNDQRRRRKSGSTYTPVYLRDMARNHAKAAGAVLVAYWIEVANDWARLGVRMREPRSETLRADEYIRL